MKIAQATVINEYGIHCRPSALIIRETNNFPNTTFTLDAGNGEEPLDSIMGLLAMDMGNGTKVTVRATGGDEQVAADKMAEMLSTNFDFKR